MASELSRLIEHRLHPDQEEIDDAETAPLRENDGAWGESTRRPINRSDFSFALEDARGASNPKDHKVFGMVDRRTALAVGGLIIFLVTFIVLMLAPSISGSGESLALTDG